LRFKQRSNDAHIGEAFFSARFRFQIVKNAFLKIDQFWPKLIALLVGCLLRSAFDGNLALQIANHFIGWVHLDDAPWCQ
jgi:hypothetical protein